MRSKKIALVGFRLSGGGGGRVMANLSNYFYEKGLDVHIIIFHDEIGFPFSGKVFNLGKLKSNRNSIFNKIKRFYHLNKYIKQNNFDFIIDFRFRVNLIQELLLSKYIFKSNTIYTVHSSKLDVYMPNTSWLTRYMYGKSYKVVAVTQDLLKLIKAKHGLKNLQTIYNSVDVKRIQSLSVDSTKLGFEYIIGVGAFDDNVKQFDVLIKAFADSVLPKKNIHLVILGLGSLKDYLVSVAEKKQVSNYVHFLGFKKNPYKYMGSAKFLVMTSKFEGFSMVTLESLVSGTPVIAYDCPTGPREIIVHMENGILIENQNFDELVRAINQLSTEKKLYKHLKRNEVNIVNKFSIDEIGRQWLDLMEINCDRINQIENTEIVVKANKFSIDNIGKE